MLTPGLKLDRVQFYAYDETWICDPTMDLVDDLEDDSAAIFQWAAVLVGTLVGRLGEKLGKQVAMSAVSVWWSA